MDTIQVVVSDDNPVAREALPRLLAAEGDIQVIGVARNGLEACRIAGDSKPHVVVMDMKMPVMDGIEATRRIKQADPSMKVIILSIYDRSHYVTESLRAGASAYLFKGVSVGQLADTIRRAHHEGRNGDDV